MPESVQPKTLVIYADNNGYEPFTEWLEGLRDTKGKQRIQARLRRLEAGLYGDCEPVGEGVMELRLFFGPGYRVYFGEEAGNLVILLCGGDKSTQRQDIETAKRYWKEHQEYD